jgi:C4-type Zn-finger protein
LRIRPADENTLRQKLTAMHELLETTVSCPYCGERLDVLLDPSVPHQDYIEDCQVCCRPVIFDVTVADGGEVSVFVRSENE